MKELVEGAKTAWRSLGSVDYGRKSSELGNVQFRRSLYFIEDIEKGELVTKDNVKSIRPGYGIAPKFFEEILGKKLLKTVKSGTAVSWDCLEK